MIYHHGIIQKNLMPLQNNKLRNINHSINKILKIIWIQIAKNVTKLTHQILVWNPNYCVKSYTEMVGKKFIRMATSVGLDYHLNIQIWMNITHRE